MKKCAYCGRNENETKLNIEGFIHHNSKVRCINLKDCKKFAKKIKKKNAK